MENLVGGCKSMDGNMCPEELPFLMGVDPKFSLDSKRSKFAMQLSNCHLERSGLPVPPCTADMELVEW